MASIKLQQHCVVRLGHIAYYVRNRVEKAIKLPHTSGIVIPTVVVDVQGKSIDIQTLKDKFDEFERTDDVFQSTFLEGAVINVQSNETSVGTVTISSAVDAFMKSKSSKIIVSAHDETPVLPQGPYFFQNGNLHQAWRLYEDKLDSFVTTVVPADSGKVHEFQPLPGNAYTGMHLAIAVPSRLYYPKTDEKPLNGKRITVKDNFHLTGIVTTMGSRAYAQYYGAQQVTSTLVKNLLKKGAVIIGKTKMGAFTGSEAPPEKTIDYFPPWNPRGDGYQGPSGSSMGAGSSVAGYDWVDISLGTDTTGSIRMPAASYGLWGARVTPGSFDLEGVMPSVPSFDCLGILARSSAEILELYMANESAPVNLLAPKPPKPNRILYPLDFFPMKNPGQQAMQSEFIGALEDYLGVTHTSITLAEEWTLTGPEPYRSTPLAVYMQKSGYWPNFYEGYHVYDDFIAGYTETFGKKVYTSPFMTTRWQRGIDTTKEQRDRGLEECKTVSDWFAKDILTPGTIMLIPVGRPGANYRDTIPEPSRGGPPDTAFSPNYLATAIGAPHIVVPIGQNPFDSRVSGNVEYAPIVGTLVGPKGSDSLLLEVAQAALDKAGWPTQVLTGRNTFELGNNTRNSIIGDTQVQFKL